MERRDIVLIKKINSTQNWEVTSFSNLHLSDDLIANYLIFQQCEAFIYIGVNSPQISMVYRFG